MMFCFPRGHSASKLEGQELKAQSSHVTGAGTVQMEPLLKLVGIIELHPQHD